jgi:spore coat protein H
MEAQGMTRRQFLALAAASSLVALVPRLAWAAGKLDAEERTAFFDGGKIPSLSIEIAKADIDALRKDPRKYVKATITEDGGKVTYKDVAVHLKGSAGSFRSIDENPGLTLNLDKFVEGQRFHGMDKLHLNNSVQDNTYMTELWVGEMFRAAGVPAAKVSHAAVTLNKRPLGFYVLKEGYDKTFLKTHFGSSKGNFYDGGFLKDIDQTLELSGAREDVKDQVELKALVAAAREGDRDRRFKALEKLLDLDRFVSYLAIEVISWDWDGYPFKQNNYRLYHDPKLNKVTFIPSGMDQMFADPNGPLFPEFGGLVARALIETPQGRKLYVARTAAIMKDVFVVDRWLKRLDELQARIQPELKKVDKGVAEDLPNRVNRLRDAVRQRAKSIGEQLKKA